MSRSKITLKDTVSGKTVNISSVGDTSANVVIPIKTPNNFGVSEFTFIDQEEIGEIIANKFSPGCVLQAPEITYPLNVDSGYTGGVELNNNYSIPAFGGIITITTYYEISRNIDFSSIEFSTQLTGQTIQNLPTELMANIGLKSNSELNVISTDRYYVRCKLFINSYSSAWSNIGSFQLDQSTYLKPRDPEISEVIETKIEDLYPYVKETSKTTNLGTIRSGEIKFKVSPSKTGLGTPGTPDQIIFKFTTDKSNTPTNGLAMGEYKDEIELTIENTNSEYYILDLIPHVLYYGMNYKISYKYRNSTNGIESPYSNEVIVFQQPLDLISTVSDMGIVTELSKISKNKTLNLDDIFFSDRYVQKYVSDEVWINTILNNKKPNISSFSLQLEFSGTKEGTSNRIALSNRITKRITKGQIDYFGTMTYLTTDIDEGFDYKIDLDFTFECVIPNKNQTFSFSVNQNIPSSDGITGETAETTPRKETTDGYFGYFGEIHGNTDNTIKYLGDKTRITGSLPNKYEYLKNNELYVCKQGSIDKKITDLTDTEHADIYGEILPSELEHLIDKLSIKKNNRTTDEYSSYTPIGETTTLVPYTIDHDEKTTYIKCYNKGNQLVYISKYPLSSNIKYKDLRSMFLTGNGSKTFRHGKNIFKARLLEFSPSPVLGSHYPRKETDKTNITDDVTLYRNLFGNKLANYFLGDLGIAHDTDITYTNNGFVRSYKSGNVVKHIEGELTSNQWDNIDTLNETENLTTTTSTVKNRLGYYRPVFEYVRESHLPFRLMKNYLPGPTKLVYDKGADVGYFGLMSSSEFLSGNEIIQQLNLTKDNLTGNDFSYLKFYYRGRVLFIPTKPMVVLNNDLDLIKLIKSGNFFGARDSDDYYYYKNMKYSISSITYTEKDLTTTGRQYEIQLGPDGKPTDLPVSGMIQLLLSRCYDFQHLSSGSIYLDGKAFEPWIDSLPTLNLDYPIITTDHLDGEICCLDQNLAPIRKSTVSGKIYFWPVFSVEALDLNNTITYGAWNVHPGAITYKTVRVSTKTLTPKTVTRSRPIIKNKITYEDKTVAQIVKVPNDKISFPKIPKDAKDKYGLLLFHALKTDPACDERKLYVRDKLNVRKAQNGYILGYSEEYGDIGTYIAKSVLVTNPDGLCPTPLHIATTFKEATTCRNYIRDLIQSDVELMVLKNYIPQIPYTDGNNKYPLGILYGCISSMIAYSPVNKSYDLYNELENITGDMNLNPLILEKNGKYQNTWTTMYDETGLQTVPCLNGFLDYYSYTDTGKEILTNYAKYIAIQNGMGTSQAELQSSIDTIISTYHFGIVGVDLETLYIMQDRNGVLTGSYNDPILRKLTTDYRLMNYFSTATKTGYSTGNDFTDIMHPEQGYDEVETSVVVKVPISTQYIEMEDYETTIYVEETIEEDIQVPVYSYVNA